MSTVTRIPAPTQSTASAALPDPGMRVPTLSWPIAGIFTFALALFGGSTWATVTGALPVLVTVAASAAAIFILFTVLHDASHYSISSRRWVNVAFGRVAMFFVSPLISFRSFAFIHIEHHRNTNDHDADPDHFISASPRWQLPFRFPAMDLPYIGFLVRNVRRRPRAEVAETVALMTVSVAVIAAATGMGHLWMLAVIYLIPERVAMFVLAWWFDWLPHHDLPDTQRENRYRATRNRVGGEWFLTPLLLSQNYHLVHHLHPSVPFYRYVTAWRRNEEAYLERDSAISTVFGRDLDAEQYREWKRLNGSLAGVLPFRSPHTPAAGRHESHPVPVRSVEPLTPDSVRIVFDVPDHLRERFAFQAGQHVTVHHADGGRTLRRNYSICTAAPSGEIEIAVRRIAGGTFSTFAVEALRAGDVLELSPPTGTFGAPLDPLARREHVAVAAGSGITPVLSVLRTVLAVETESRFTLIYGNRDAGSTMFAAELAELESRHPDRLRVIHIRSADAGHPVALRGRIDPALVRRILGGDLTAIDHWYLCGPSELVTGVYADLESRGTPADRMHVELFHGGGGKASADGFVDSAVTLTVGGREHTVSLAAGETILEAALRSDIDAPYACLGGACGTCRARVLCGSATMEQNFALPAAEVEAGVVLTCQSRPSTPSISVDYDG